MTVTLDISASSLRLVSFNGKGIQKWGKAPLAAGLVHDGHILQTRTVGEAIAALFESLQIPRGGVTATLSGLSFVYRIVKLPRLKPALLNEAIMRAAKKEFPLPLDEVYLSWRIIGDDKDGLEVFLVGVARSVVDALVQTLNTAGLKLQDVDLKSLALARAAGRPDALVANFDSDCFDIVLVSGGRPVILHTVAPRSDGATIEDNVRRLGDELSRTVDFYNISHAASPVQSAIPVLLSGELAADPATVQLIKDSIENPVELLTSPVGAPAGFSAASYAGNLGLALKGSRQAALPGNDAARFRDINIDVLAGRRRVRLRRLPAGSRLAPAAAVAGIVLLALAFVANNQVKADKAVLQGQVEAVSRELGLARARADEAGNNAALIRQLLDEAASLKQQQGQVLGKGVNAAELISLGVGKLPPRVGILSMEISSGQITLDGQATSKGDVISYAENLVGDARFSEVRIARIEEVPGTNGATAGIMFTIVISLKS